MSLNHKRRLISSVPFYSDITALAKDKIYTHINLDEMTIHQVSAVMQTKNHEPSYKME